MEKARGIRINLARYIMAITNEMMITFCVILLRLNIILSIQYKIFSKLLRKTCTIKKHLANAEKIGNTCVNIPHFYKKVYTTFHTIAYKLADNRRK